MLKLCFGLAPMYRFFTGTVRSFSALELLGGLSKKCYFVAVSAYIKVINHVELKNFENLFLTIYTAWVLQKCSSNFGHVPL